MEREKKSTFSQPGWDKETQKTDEILITDSTMHGRTVTHHGSLSYKVMQMIGTSKYFGYHIVPNKANYQNQKHK